MTYNVAINVMPLKDLLDPQGKAVLGGLHNLGLNNVQDEASAIQIAEEAATKLLANQVMEHFEISIL
jgi:phosphoribosylformylglycinamidine synthase